MSAPGGLLAPLFIFSRRLQRLLGDAACLVSLSQLFDEAAANVSSVRLAFS